MRHFAAHARYSVCLLHTWEAHYHSLGRALPQGTAELYNALCMIPQLMFGLLFILGIQQTVATTHCIHAQ